MIRVNGLMMWLPKWLNDTQLDYAVATGCVIILMRGCLLREKLNNCNTQKNRYEGKKNILSDNDSFAVPDVGKADAGTGGLSFGKD